MTLTIILVIIGIIIVLGLMLASMYNGLVASRTQVENAFSQMDVQMKQRADLIPPLVETVKGAAFHERGTLESVIKARNSAVSAVTPEEKMKANNEVTSALNRLMVLVENYPQLKVNDNFMKLMAELKDVEEKIRYSRQFYNDTVEKYNVRVQSFPTNIIAGMFGFAKKPFFEIPESDRQAVKVDFSSLNTSFPQGQVTRESGFGEKPLVNETVTNTNTISNPVPETTNNIDTFNNTVNSNNPQSLNPTHSIPSDNNSNNEINPQH